MAKPTSPAPKASLSRSFLVALAASIVAIIAIPTASFGQTTSALVYYDHFGRLRYATDPAGNRIIDYSSAGYRGGGVSLPRVPVRITVSPSGGDDTAAIQSALDTVAARLSTRKGSAGPFCSLLVISTFQQR